MIARTILYAVLPFAIATSTALACGTCEHCKAKSTSAPQEPKGVPVAKQNPRKGANFRFGVLGDTQGLQYVEQLITDMNAHDPALVVFPGDLVGTGSASSWGQWDSLTEHFIAGPNRRLMVPGNHDLPVGGDALWQQTFNWLPDSQPVGGVRGLDQMDYYYDFGNSRFISVTTDSQQNGAGGPPAAQQWLENVLSDPTTQSKDHVFVYSHHPVTFNNYDSTGGTSGDWWQALGNAGNVRGLFVGHWHQYQPSQPHPHHNTWEVISGTGNAGYSGHPWQNEIGYSIVEVEGPRAYLKFYGDADGDGSYDDLLDTFTMADVRPGPAGIVAHYGFDDQATNLDTALSEIAKANHGALYGNAQIAEEGPRSFLQLDGNGDYADGRGIGDYNLAVLGDLTISVEASFSQLFNGAGQNTLVSYSADVAGYTDREEAVNQPYNLRIRGDRRLELMWERGNNNQKEIFVSSIPADVMAGDWHEYRVTRDAENGEVTFFVDGVQLGDALVFDSSQQLPTGGAQGILRMGINYDRDHPAKLVGAFEGQIDEVSIWNLVTMESYATPMLGDLNLDGIIDDLDIDDFISGWMDFGLEDDLLTRWNQGDLNLNGRSELEDVVLFQRALHDVGLTFPGLPEPSGFKLVWLGIISAFGVARDRRR